MRREVREEACAEVTNARLLGFGRGACVRGHEVGVVLVRSMWVANVALHPWSSEWEMICRQAFPAAEALTLVRDALDDGHKRVITRLFAEAHLLPTI